MKEINKMLLDLLNKMLLDLMRAQDTVTHLNEQSVTSKHLLTAPMKKRDEIKEQILLFVEKLIKE